MAGTVSWEVGDRPPHKQALCLSHSPGKYHDDDNDYQHHWKWWLNMILVVMMIPTIIAPALASSTWQPGIQMFYCSQTDDQWQLFGGYIELWKLWLSTHLELLNFSLNKYWKYFRIWMLSAHSHTIMTKTNRQTKIYNFGHIFLVVLLRGRGLFIITKQRIW